MKTDKLDQPDAIADSTIEPQSNCLSQEDSQPLIYANLFHGRKNPTETLSGQGAEGPTFGPYRFVHTTYTRTIQLERPDGRVDELSWDEHDFIYYDGVYFGDLSLFRSSKPLASVKYPKMG